MCRRYRGRTIRRISRPVEPEYPDYPDYPPDKDCDEIGKKNINVRPGDPHVLTEMEDGIGSEPNEGMVMERIRTRIESLHKKEI